MAGDQYNIRPTADSSSHGHNEQEEHGEQEEHDIIAGAATELSQASAGQVESQNSGGSVDYRRVVLMSILDRMSQSLETYQQQQRELIEAQMETNSRLQGLTEALRVLCNMLGNVLQHQNQAD
ncbi:hypothetical protein FBU31_003260 [Coemansia sp. 'formosensis']|nr:hypothetical protein FBU31_003260 [Coemansia sp. 'formosensis']